MSVLEGKADFPVASPDFSQLDPTQTSTVLYACATRPRLGSSADASGSAIFATFAEKALVPLS
jgi:hypothetical protein